MPRWFALPSTLREHGVLGINRRNLDYILQRNPRHNYPFVDNKLLTKRICEEHSIPTPKTYGVLASQGEVQRFEELVQDHADFVVKPAGGVAGRGILVISEHAEGIYVTPGGRRLPAADLRYHLSAVISGLYSIGGRVDQVIIEQRVVTHPALAPVAIGGTPDLRVVLSRGVPIMAMLRLPTYASSGRANLHQGAIAAAVDLVEGVTYGGVCKDRIIEQHPDTGRPIAGIELPGWHAILDATMRLSDLLGLEYLGVDIMLDADSGPLVLEANARPGLAIQLAHREGLLPRLEMVDQTPEPERVGEARWDLIPRIAATRGRKVT